MPIGGPGADMRFREIGRQVEGVAMRQRAGGQIITPRTSISEAVAALGRKGGRIFLGEGEWHFKDTLDITRPNVEIIGASPGASIITRLSTMTGAAIKLSGAECRIEGIRFEDASSTAGHKTIEIAANKCTVSRCTFADCNIGVYGTGIEFLSVDQCTFLDVAQAGIYITGSSEWNKALGNTFVSYPSGGYAVFYDDNVTRSNIVGNIADTTPTKAYSYKSAGAMVAAYVAGNVGTIDVR